MTATPAVADVYPLTPLQRGMLFHSVSATHRGAYVEQFTARLEDLDTGRFRAAWEAVVRTHAVFRTAFLWDTADRPLQAVLSDVTLPFTIVAGDLQTTCLAEVERGFALDRAPLMRLVLLERDDGAYDVVWTHHHLLLDGWSVALVLDDVARAYRREPLVAPRPFRDFVSWLGSRDREREREFWRAELREFDRTTPLPLGTVPRVAGARATAAAVLPEAELAALHHGARAQRISLAALIQAAWGLVLAKHAGTDDVVFGVTVSGRPAELAGVERMVGPFINTLPVRMRVPPDARQPAWLMEQHRRLARLREVEHSDLNAIQRDAGRVLFETLVLVPNAAARGDDSGAKDTLHWRDTRFTHERTNLPLTAALAPDGSITISYDTASMSDGAARTIADHFRQALLGLSEGQDRTLRDITLLAPEERERLLAAARAPARESDDVRCLHELFEAHADVTPDAIAIEDDTVALSYADLERRANGLAQWLIARGVGPESLVAVAMERSAELVVALLAVLKAGGGYVPIDPALPEARRAFMAADAGVVLTLTELPADEGSATRPAHRAACTNAAYVIYTSGSTGAPKGVIAEHRGLVNLVSCEHTPGRVAFLTSIGFDVSLQEVFGALGTGGTLVVFSADEQRDLASLPRLTAERDVEVVHLTPSVLGALDRPLGVRRVIAAGEALTSTAATRVVVADAELDNHYGPTETHVVLTHRSTGLGPVPIGRPIAGVSAYVLDLHLEPVPDGVAGELYVGGTSVARGYLGRPALTAERFVPDPFGHGRLYRTGDVVVARGGVLDFLGRRDRQVKIRGHRVELGEVEAAIGDAVVVADGDRLVAYARRPIELDALRRALPAYLVPSAVVVVDQWPRTVNGKIDHAALPAPEANHASYVAPRDAREEALASIWAALLGAERVGLADDFFALGGDSITAMQMISRAKRELGVTIAIGRWLEQPTLRALAGGIDESCSLLARGRSDRPPLVLIHPGSGSILPYRAFAQGLADELTVYGIEASSQTQDLSVERLADQYERLIPEGPVHLGGWSFGGLVALELAQRMPRDRVGAVVLLDTWHPDELARLNLLEARSADGDMVEASRAAMAAYRPPSYEGRMVLVRAADDPRGRLADERLGWSATTEVHPVSGTHDDLLAATHHATLASVVLPLLATEARLT